MLYNSLFTYSLHPSIFNSTHISLILAKPLCYNNENIIAYKNIYNVEARQSIIHALSLKAYLLSPYIYIPLSSPYSVHLT